MVVLLAGSPGLGLASSGSSYIPIEKGALEKAVLESRETQKYMLVAFLGEGWSVSCGKFKDRVLDTPLFREFAGENLVYFPVEARRKPKLTPGETAVLQSWVIHFDIKAYPTLILIAPDGQELLRHGYKDIHAEEYIDLLRAILPLAGSSG